MFNRLVIREGTLSCSFCLRHPAASKEDSLAGRSDRRHTTSARNFLLGMILIIFHGLTTLHASRLRCRLRFKLLECDELTEGRVAELFGNFSDDFDE